ncbi:MAG: hypothetical protein JKX71_13435 [Amylibacter sp.]|nr:hypothetical protein [Amylibacter sp.]
MQLEDDVAVIKRPKILLLAAKIGLRTYSRNKELKRLFKMRTAPQPPHALGMLRTREIDLEKARKKGKAAYDMKLHIQVMTALLQELYLSPKKS